MRFRKRSARIAVKSKESTAASGVHLTQREAAILAAIVLASIAIYLPSLRNGWVFDDWQEFVQDNTDSQLVVRLELVPPRLCVVTDPGGGLARSAYYRPLENTWFGRTR